MSNYCHVMFSCRQAHFGELKLGPVSRLLKELVLNLRWLSAEKNRVMVAQMAEWRVKVWIGLEFEYSRFWILWDRDSIVRGYLCNGWNAMMNGITKMPKSVPHCRLLLKYFLAPIDPKCWIDVECIQSLSPSLTPLSLPHQPTFQFSQLHAKWRHICAA